MDGTDSVMAGGFLVMARSSPTDIAPARKILKKAKPSRTGLHPANQYRI